MRESVEDPFIRSLGDVDDNKLLELAQNTPGAFALAALTALRARLDSIEEEKVRDARDAGLSWTDVGGLLGISKQSAWSRHRFPDEPDADDAVVLVEDEEGYLVPTADSDLTNWHGPVPEHLTDQWYVGVGRPNGRPGETISVADGTEVFVTNDTGRPIAVIFGGVEVPTAARWVPVWKHFPELEARLRPWIDLAGDKLGRGKALVTEHEPSRWRAD